MRQMYPGISAIDGNRIRFSFSDWKSMVAIKVLRHRIREVMQRAWKSPDKELTESQKGWVGIFWEVMEGVKKASGRERRSG